MDRGVRGGDGGYSPWGHREADMTKQLNNNILDGHFQSMIPIAFTRKFLSQLHLPKSLIVSGCSV